MNNTKSRKPKAERNTKTRRPKAARRNNPEQPYQLFAEDWAAPDIEVQQMVGETLLDEAMSVAARFQRVADLTLNPRNKPKLSDTDLEQIKQIAEESERSDYRRIMGAIIEAAGQGERGIYSAQMTASRVVDLFFTMRAEYLVALRVYQAKLRIMRLK